MEALLITVSMLGLRLTILQALHHVVDGAYYRLLDKKGTYVQGRQVCQANCLDLAKVTSKQDLEEMNAYFSKTKGRLAFLGAHYNGTSFIWADGEPMLVTNWATNHPKHPDTKQCVAISKRTLTWFTWNCGKSLFLLCGQKELQCKVTIYSMTTWTPGRSMSATPTHSMGQISLSECARKYLQLKTCHHFLTSCQLYSNKLSNRTMNTVTMEIRKRN